MVPLKYDIVGKGSSYGSNGGMAPWGKAKKDILTKVNMWLLHIWCVVRGIGFGPIVEGGYGAGLFEMH